MNGCQLPRFPISKPRQRRQSDASNASKDPKKQKSGKGKRGWLRSIIGRRRPKHIATPSIKKRSPIIREASKTPPTSPWLATAGNEDTYLLKFDATPPPFHERRRSSQFRLSAKSLLLTEEVRSPRPKGGEQFLPLVRDIGDVGYCGIELELHNMCSVIKTTIPGTGKTTIREVTGIAITIARRTTFAVCTKFLWPFVKAKATTTLLFPSFEMPTFRPSPVVRDFATSESGASAQGTDFEQSRARTERIKRRLKSVLGNRKKRCLSVNTSTANDPPRKEEHSSPPYHPKNPECNIGDLVLSTALSTEDQDEEHPSPQYHKKRVIDDERFPGLFNKPRLSSSIATVASHTFYVPIEADNLYRRNIIRQQECEVSGTPFSTLLRCNEVVTDHETTPTESRPGTAHSRSSWLSTWDVPMPGSFVVVA